MTDAVRRDNDQICYQSTEPEHGAPHRRNLHQHQLTTFGCKLCRELCIDATLGARLTESMPGRGASLEICRSWAQDHFHKEGAGT
jgi:hypothetical protein